MNTRRNVGQRIRGEASGNNHVPPLAPAEGLVLPVNPTGFTDVEVRLSLDKMEHAITMQAHAMTAEVKR